MLLRIQLMESSGKIRHMKSTISSDFLRITLFKFFHLLFLQLYKNMVLTTFKLPTVKMYFFI